MRDIENPIDQMWLEDALGRREDARYLQNYLDARHKARPNEPGFVLAVNAEWGHGKSFMLERWMKESVFQGHPAIYFDAWKNDFTGDPLLAFISELEEGLTEHFKAIPLVQRERTRALNALKKVWKPALTIIASAAAKHIAGVSLEKVKETLFDAEPSDDKDKEGVSGAIKETSKSLTESIKKALEPHKTVKESISRFKASLSELVTHLETLQNVRLPLLVFIDELDRCRPDYAIELLEGVKHLFGVPGVTFVVATNISQLSHSIKAVYGSSFDGQRYLQRFFDLQYTLAKPNNLSFSRLMLKGIKLPEKQYIVYGLEQDSLVHPVGPAPHSSLDYISKVLAAHADSFTLSLRDIAQVTTILEACFITLTERIHIFFLVFLASVYQVNPVYFKQIRSRKSLGNVNTANIVEESGLGKITVVDTWDYSGRIERTRDMTMLDIATTYFNMLQVAKEALIYSLSWQGQRAEWSTGEPFKPIFRPISRDASRLSVIRTDYGIR